MNTPRTTPAQERPTGDAPGVTLVDCDVHPMFAPAEAVNSYLSDASRARLELLGYSNQRLRTRYWSAHYGWAGGARVDAHPAEGESALERLRSQLLDAYGVDYGILNGDIPYAGGPELAADSARASNEYLLEHWLDPEPRLLGSILVPWDHPDLAVGEIERRAGEGRWVQVLMPGEAMEPLGARKYRPIYEAATAHGLPLATHIGFYDPHHGTGWPSYTFERHLGFAHTTRRQLLSMVCEGVFDAVPGVRVVMVEGGVSWAASLRWALDSAFALLGEEARLERRPSEYLDEFVWFTTQPIEEPDDPEDLLRAIEHGRLEDRLLFSTDYPHWDFDSPTQALPRALPTQLRQRILAGNACALYGLPR